MKRKTILLFLVIGLLLIPSISAQISDDFIKTLSQTDAFYVIFKTIFKQGTWSFDTINASVLNANESHVINTTVENINVIENITAKIFNSTFDMWCNNTNCYTIANFLNISIADKTTDDLTEGSTNLYDNQSWNKTHADTLYAVISLTDTNASTECSGTTTYLDGEGNCDDISSVYVQNDSHTELASANIAGNTTVGEYILSNQGNTRIRFETDGSVGILFA